MEYRIAKITDFDIEKNLDKDLIDNIKWSVFKNNITDLPLKQGTKFALLNGDECLYAFYVVSDDYINPIRTRYNDKIYNEEVVELFIASKNNIGKYIELEVSPNNTKFCGLIRNNLKGSRKLRLLNRCIFSSVIIKNDKGYIAVLKINKKQLCGHLNIRNTGSFSFNAYRIDRPLNLAWELYALNPTNKYNFHMPEFFIDLK